LIAKQTEVVWFDLTVLILQLSRNIPSDLLRVRIHFLNN